MKQLKLLPFAICLGMLMAAPATAQETWWRIVSGRGSGVILKTTNSLLSCFYGPCIDDPAVGASGLVTLGHFDDCECSFADGHYHGTLFDDPDPDPNGCGWGCAIQIPCDSNTAYFDVRGDIDEIGNNLDPFLASKLHDIVDLMEGAADMGCYSVVEALADAFADELYAGFVDTPYRTEYDAILRDFANYVSVTEYEMDLGYAHVVPLLKPFTVGILERVGTGPRSRLVDAGPRMTARVGQLISLEAYGMDPGYYRWDYKWKGAEIGELPGGVGLGYYSNRVSIISEIKTSLRLSVQLQYPSHKPARDTIMINFVP